MSISRQFPEPATRVLHVGMEMATLVIYTAYITYIILILQLDVAICWTSEMVYSSFILIFCWRQIQTWKLARKENLVSLH